MLRRGSPGDSEMDLRRRRTHSASGEHTLVRPCIARTTESSCGDLRIKMAFSLALELWVVLYGAVAECGRLGPLLGVCCIIAVMTGGSERVDARRWSPRVTADGMGADAAFTY